MSKSVSFFADLNDFKSIANAVEKGHIHYFEAGSFPDDKIPHYDSLLEIPDLGKSDHGIVSLNNYYLVLPIGLDVQKRVVPQRAGGVRYFIDQLINPVSLVLRTGGIWEESAIVPSALDTLSTDPLALSFLGDFKREIRKFKKVNSFPVGPSSMLKLIDGLRFTYDVRSPINQDLPKP